jgi:hypothetical protein
MNKEEAGKVADYYKQFKSATRRDNLVVYVIVDVVVALTHLSLTKYEIRIILHNTIDDFSILAPQAENEYNLSADVVHLI